MGERIGNTRQHCFDQLADAQFMHRVGDGPQQAHRDGFDTARAHGRKHGPHCGLVERGLDTAFGIHPLWNLESQATGNIGRGIFHLQVMRLGLAAFLQQQNVRETRSGEEGRARGLALDDGIGAAGRAVEKHRSVGEQSRHFQAQFFRCDFERRSDAGKGALAIGQGFANGEMSGGVGHDHVGERAPGVDGDAIWHGSRP